VQKKKANAIFINVFGTREIKILNLSVTVQTIRMKKIRLDQLLMEKGLAESREKAKRLILAGQIIVDGHPSPKPGHPLSPDQLKQLNSTFS